MGCNITLFKSKSEDQEEEEIERKVLILGLDNAGKTSILFLLKDNEFNGAQTPTIGLNVEAVKYKNCNITFWDVGGQATMLWKHYYQDTHAVVFVVDASNKDRVTKAKEELHSVIQDTQLEDCPILILGNKQDLSDVMNEQELKKELEFESLMKKEKAIQMCSAKKNEGVWEGMEKLIQIMKQSAENKEKTAASSRS